MKELCIDASVVLKLVLKGEQHRAAARRLLRDCLANNISLIAPHLYECEVDTVIRKRVHEGRLTLANAEKALAGLDMVPVRVMTHPDLRGGAREIASRFNLRTVYDATYAALAQLRGCEFYTADKAFCDAVKSGLRFVKYLPDY